MLNRLAAMTAVLVVCGAGRIVSAAEPVVVTTNAAMGLSTKRVVPAYPVTAKQLHVTGELEVKVVVDETGAVTDAKVLKGNVMFTNASIAAAKAWKFTPLTKDGTVTAFETTLVFQFGSTK
jgi:TonB family protein